jgi:hypothetical protein
LSRKHVISIDLFSSDDASVVNDMSANCLSREVEVKNLDAASIHCSWAAGPVGEAQVNDQDDWFEINSSTAWAITGADSEAQINLESLPFTKIRLKYIRTSGSGTLSAYMTAKTVGA